MGEISQEINLLTTWEVIDEVATKLSYFVSKVALIDFLELIKKSGTHVIYPNENNVVNAIALFKRTKSKNISLTDCFNATACKEYKVDYILSFDKDYKKVGVKIYT